MNTIGTCFRITSFGESHGKYIGVVIDGFPSNIIIDKINIANELKRRKPGQSHITTSRLEDEDFEIISGVFENKSTGAPICVLIPNQNQISEHYQTLNQIYRPSHADFTYQQKYGIRDVMGGGRSSARVTAGWVVAGALAKQILNEKGISIKAYVNKIHQIELQIPYQDLDLDKIELSKTRCPDIETAQKMESLIEQTKQNGDSLGGEITCIIQNCPIGLGNPVFGKLHAQLSHAILSINACKGIAFGAGFDMANYYGSEMNDEFYNDHQSIKTKTNNSGGIQGGISNGMDIVFKAIFKPTSSISKTQNTVNLSGEETSIAIKGRHDPCVLPRAVPIVEAMAAIVLFDEFLKLG